ncbi:hypothetical protein BDW22DRAFT_1427766 [Trametopsis cervina]|nr:hypothetical protein BDW22DRAFT_1427766 [Trametopsis cervina]
MAPAKPLWAGDPFASSTADIILRSSDNFHLRVHTQILSTASSVFAGLFISAQPSPHAALTQSSPRDEMLNGLPVIDMAESSAVLECVLRLYYPPFCISAAADAPDIPVICDALLACRKYELQHAADAVSRHFASAVARGASTDAAADPDTNVNANVNGALRGYTHACARSMHTEMRVAARASLAHPLAFTASPELDAASGRAIFRLLMYRQECAAAAARAKAKSPAYWVVKSELSAYQIAVRAQLVMLPWSGVVLEPKLQTQLRMIAYHHGSADKDPERETSVREVERAYMSAIDAEIDKVELVID